jgi:alpha-tubulin suppressor-like RCC1 family protein
VLSDGAVECWGDNYSGQLGNSANYGSVPSINPAPSAVTGLTGSGLATGIAAGGNHTCALLSDGTVDCWGDNYYGQLGNSANYGTATANPAPLAVTGLTGSNLATGIAAGLEHTCALLANGTVECWGDNANGQLGNDSTTNSDVPVTVIGDVVPGAGAKQIASGYLHSCALLSDGTVQCWGDDDSGQLGDGNTNPSSTPMAVSGGTGVLSGVTAIAAGAYHTCALLANGTVQCWGDDDSGQLGNGSTTTDMPVTTPVTVQAVGGGGTLTGVKAIAAGEYHTCALLANGSVACWGDDSTGQLGDGGSTYSDVPVAATELSTLGTIKAIAAGGYHSCVLIPDGQVYCLGFNDFGQLGDYSVSNSLTPALVNLLPDPNPPSSITATAITASQENTCALIADGSAQCWGYNYYGDLGNGSQNASDVPVIVSGLSGGTGISAGSAAGTDHTCAVLASGAAECWGEGSYGELGNNSANSSEVPVTVSLALNIAKAISAQQYATCALLADGTVDCWGNDYSGELGNGAAQYAAPSYVPVPTLPLVPSLSWTSGTTSVATIGSESGLATPASLTSTGTTLITASYSLPTPLTAMTTLTVGIAPAVVTGPMSQTVAAGTTAAFTAAYNSDAYPTPSVQWQVSVGGGSFMNYTGPGATSTSISFTAPIGDNGNRYQAVISNTLGTVTAGPATLTVATPPALSKQFGVSSIVSSIPLGGSTALTFTVTEQQTPRPR